MAISLTLLSFNWLVPPRDEMPFLMQMWVSCCVRCDSLCDSNCLTITLQVSSIGNASARPHSHLSTPCASIFALLCSWTQYPSLSLSPHSLEGPLDRWHWAIRLPFYYYSAFDLACLMCFDSILRRAAICDFCIFILVRSTLSIDALLSILLTDFAILIDSPYPLLPFVLLTCASLACIVTTH